LDLAGQLPRLSPQQVELKAHVVIIKFIYLQDQELFVFPVQVMQLDQVH
jgi:hypothetical protein